MAENYFNSQSSVNMIFSAGLECLKKENREQVINEIDGSGLFSWKIITISHLTQCWRITAENNVERHTIEVIGYDWTGGGAKPSWECSQN